MWLPSGDQRGIAPGGSGSTFVPARFIVNSELSSPIARSKASRPPKMNGVSDGDGTAALAMGSRVAVGLSVTTVGDDGAGGELRAQPARPTASAARKPGIRRFGAMSVAPRWLPAVAEDRRLFM